MNDRNRTTRGADGTASTTGADLFADALASYGVTHVFGNPGTTELPLLEAIAERDLAYVLGLHEDVAVGMAAGYATRRRYHATDDPDVNPLGVVNLHLAPGLAHGLGNLDGAQWAGAPLLVTAGQHSRHFQHEEPILAGDTARMAEQFTKWSAEVKHVDALPTMLRRAVRVALTPPTGPVFLALPVDVQRAKTTATPERLGPIPDAGRGDPRQIARAVEVIARADEPVFVVGQQVAHAGPDAVDAAVELAEASGAAVYGEVITAETAFPATHDQWISVTSAGEDGFAAAHDTDTVVFLGTTSHTTSIRHENPLVSRETTCIHVTDDAWELGKNFPADVAVLGDPGRVAAELATEVAQAVDDTERARRLERVHEHERASGMTERHERSDRLSKHRLARAIRAAVPDACVVNESLTSTRPLREEFPMEVEQHAGNKSGGLGYGLPATVGAGIAEREVDDGRPVVGFLGDGSYLYYPHTLYSAARYGVDVTVIVSDNRNYRILKDNTVRLLGGAEEDYEFVGMDFDPPVDFVQNARSHGADGEMVTDPAEIDEAVARAVEHDGPYVVDALVHD